MRHIFWVAIAVCGLVAVAAGCSRTVTSRPGDPQANNAADNPRGRLENQPADRKSESTSTTAGGDPSALKSRGESAPESSKSFVLHSPAVINGGELPKDYTGDGTAATLPLEWSGTPEGTKSFAVIMHHVAPDRVKWYWILYDISIDVHSIPRNVTGIGKLGNNSVNGRQEYAPPHSKGPGPKTYIYTVYALSSPPKITVEPSQVTRDVLLAAMKGLILDSAELRVTYTRFPERDRDHESDPPPRKEDPF